MRAEGYTNVTTSTDRHGVVRWRYRKHGRVCYLPGQPGEQCFDDAYPKLGYVRSNVRIVCEIVNLAMNNWGEEPLRLLVRRMRYFKAENGNV